MFFIFVAAAQIEKGTIAPGGAIALSYKASSKTGQKMFDFSVAPHVGFFVVNNLEIGPTIGYKVNSVKQQSGNTDLTQSFFVGPSLKYYIKIGNKAYIHCFGSILGNFGSYRQITDPPSNTSLGTRGAIWQLGTGLTFFVHPSVAVAVSPMYIGDFTQYYLKNKAGIVSGSTSNEVTHGFYLNAGLNIFLRKKQ